MTTMANIETASGGSVAIRNTSCRESIKALLLILASSAATIITFRKVFHQSLTGVKLLALKNRFWPKMLAVMEENAMQVVAIVITCTSKICFLIVA